MRRGVIAFLCASVVLAASARADTVYLKNGRVLEGSVISEDEKVVVVELASGIVRLAAGDVLRIERTPPDEKLATDLRTMSRAGRGDEALARLDKEAKSLPKAEARALRIEILRAEAARLEKGLRLAEAYRTLVEVMTLAPRDAEVAYDVDRLARKLHELRALVKRARLSVKGGELTDAVALFEKALRVAPESRPLLAPELADACRRLGSKALGASDPKAADWYARAMRADPSLAEELQEPYVHARLLPILTQMKEGDTEDASAALDSLLDFAPEDSQARYVYGRLLQSRRRWRAAAGHFLRALPKPERPAGDTPTDSASVAQLRKLVEKHLAGVHDEATAKRLEREERARVEPGAAMRMTGHHFVVHHRNVKLAREVLAVSDAQVDRVLVALARKRIPPWKESCPIYLIQDEETYLRSTGQPLWSGGVSHTETLGNKLVRQYLTVYQTCPALLKTTVPHEVTHLVFSAATAYTSGIPRSIHEGFAVSLEPEYVDRYARSGKAMLLWKRMAGTLIPLADLYGLKDVGLDPTLFYAQSASVADFLMTRMGPRVFLKFAVDVGKGDVATALKTHYGMALADLWREWLASLDG
jgi:tetratricopeptide (TPR) repeat protein